MKHCTSCGQTKKDSCFNLNRKTKDGLQAYCRACNTKYSDAPEIEPRVCALPECGKVFKPKRQATIFCRPRCHDKAKGMNLEAVSLENSFSKLPQKAFIGAEEMECVVL